MLESFSKRSMSLYGRTPAVANTRKVALQKPFMRIRTKQHFCVMFSEMKKRDTQFKIHIELHTKKSKTKYENVRACV